MTEAVIKIFYKDRYGTTHLEPQGKIYLIGEKPTYLADMTPHKWWVNYAGYSISKQILDAFSKKKIRPDIIYRVKEKNILYYATPTIFKKKGVLVPYGDHQQYILPIQYFKAREGTLEREPKNLPAMKLSDWIKGSASPAQRPNLDKGVEINTDVRRRLWEENKHLFK